MVVAGDNEPPIVASIAELVLRAFFLGRNGRPSRRLGGHTPAGSYMDDRPTEEPIDAVSNGFSSFEDAKRWRATHGYNAPIRFDARCCARS